MKTVYLSIFWKFLIAIVLTVALFGILNVTLVWNKVFQIIDSEIFKKVINIGNNVANQSIHYILYKDISSLQTIVENTKKIDPIIQYCFIIDNNNNVLAHSFNSGFPKNLLNANKMKSGDSFSIIDINALNFTAGHIKDVMLPILDGRVGYIRIGINDNIARYDLNKALVTFIIIFLSFTLLGFLGSFVFSYLITNPIKKIKNAAENVDLNNIDKNIFINIHEKKRFDIPLIIKINDETDDLIEKFNEMIHRLDSTYQKLNATQNAMNQSEKLASIGTLVAGIAHEINNPLSGLQSCIRRLNDQPDNYEQNNRYLSIMNEAILKIKNVVNGLLDFTRKSNNIRVINNLSNILNNAVNLIQYRNINNITITGNYISKDILFECDRNEMEQVFFNLLKNSIDAIDEKLKFDENLKGKIDINISENDTDIEIEIFDDGIGIPKESMNKIFDPFFTTKDVGKGTGLGCSICYNIVKEHNGIIIYNSVQNEWTKVKVIFNKTGNELK